eukprot:5752228-Amphidinium_carterae.1
MQRLLNLREKTLNVQTNRITGRHMYIFCTEGEGHGFIESFGWVRRETDAGEESHGDCCRALAGTLLEAPAQVRRTGEYS